MKSSTFAFVTFAVLGLGLAQPAIANNLVASLNNKTGTVSVQNTGGGFAPGSVATIQCSGTCPDPVGPLVAPYLNPALPGVVAVDVPALGPNQTYNHALPFWNTLDFSGGIVVLVTCADGGNQVAETNETDNCSKQTHGERRPKGFVDPKNKNLKLTK